jgi:UDP-glucose:glycoprotein glucosyltransferase
MVGMGDEKVLYADPTSPEFGEFHKPLVAAARAGNLKYRLRYRRSTNSSDGALPVSGYGVELVLKRTDYIVIDDRESATNHESQKPIGTETLFDDEDSTDIRPLSSSELATLGLKTASFIQHSGSPFQTLVKLMQDFPRFSASISAHNVSEEFSAAYEEVAAQRIPKGVNAIWINGVQLIERQIEPFALVERLRGERKLIDGVRSLGLNAKQAISLLGHESVVEAKTGDEDAVRYDWTDRNEDGRVIIWLNDLESDSRYHEYPRTVASVRL